MDPRPRRVRRLDGADWRVPLRIPEAGHVVRLAGAAPASGQAEVAVYRSDMVRGIGELSQITLCLLWVAGCTGGESESEAASETSTSTSTTSGGSSSTGASSSTTSGGSAPTGTAGESGTEDSGSTDATVTAGETGTPSGPGFVVDIWPIFDASCSCHKDSGGAGMLRLTSDDAYVNLVGVLSTQAKTMMIVEPGSSEDSYLWYKLNDTQLEVGGYGMRMPSGGLLGPAELELIQQWIDAGANP